MMKLAAVALALFVAISFQAKAGTSSGQLSELIIIGDSVIFTAGVHVNQPPTCNANGNQWTFDLTAPGGRAMLATLIFARSQQGLIAGLNVTGTGACGTWAREAPYLIQVLWP